MKIEIESTKIEERTGTSERTGRGYVIREQQALMFKDGERFPDKIKLNLQAGQSAYQVGIYDLDDKSFGLSRYGSIECRPVLVAVQNAKSAV